MSDLISGTGERGFIKAIRERYPMALVGDDAAVLPSLKKPVVTTDSFFEGSHFHRWWTSPASIAERLAEAALSDLAAMGAESKYLFSSTMLPPDMELSWIMDFYRGLTSRKDCPVAGGETVKGPSFGITLTAIGDCGEGVPFLRSAAVSGDILWVTGPVGRAFNAPELLEGSRERELSPAERRHVRLFLNPRARFDAVPAMREAGARCAIDISDGLFSECSHICSESGVGIRLHLDQVPLVDYCRGNPLEACSAGEDFELLFTLPEGMNITGFHRIGTVTETGNLEVMQKGVLIPVKGLGYDHFMK